MTQRPQMLHVPTVLAATLLSGCLLLIACNGQPDQDRDTRSTGRSTDEIRTTLEGLLTAAISGDADKLPAFLAPSCRSQSDLIAAISRLGDLLPEGRVEVKIPDVELQEIDEQRVKVTDLPGLEVLVDGMRLPETVGVTIVDPDFQLVREPAGWRLENCDDNGQ